MRAAAAHPALSLQPQYGGVVYAESSGAVSLIDSTVTRCSAGQVRELAACSAARQLERDREGPRLPHPTLFSQPQYGGVVDARASGAVSLTSSTLTGCWAVRKRSLGQMPMRMP